MQLSVDISLYPLAEKQYEDIIWAFIKRVREDNTVKIETNGMSSQIFGEYDAVTSCLAREIKLTYAQTGSAIFVCKYVLGDRSDIEIPDVL